MGSLRTKLLKQAKKTGDCVLIQLNFESFHLENLLNFVIIFICGSNRPPSTLIFQPRRRYDEIKAGTWASHEGPKVFQIRSYWNRSWYSEVVDNEVSRDRWEKSIGRGLIPMITIMKLPKDALALIASLDLRTASFHGMRSSTPSLTSLDTYSRTEGWCAQSFNLSPVGYRYRSSCRCDECGHSIMNILIADDRQRSEHFVPRTQPKAQDC